MYICICTTAIFASSTNPHVVLVCLTTPAGQQRAMVEYEVKVQFKAGQWHTVWTTNTGPDRATAEWFTMTLKECLYDCIGLRRSVWRVGFFEIPQRERGLLTRIEAEIAAGEILPQQRMFIRSVADENLP